MTKLTEVIADAQIVVARAERTALEEGNPSAAERLHGVAETLRDVFWSNAKHSL